MRALVACELSGQTRRALRARGHDAWSCDLEPSDDDSPHHIIGDAILAAYAMGPWDLIVAHPPCTYLANCAALRLYAGGKKAAGPDPQRWARMGHGAALFQALLNAPARFVAVENPIMVGHPRRLFDLPDPCQTVQPWQFGHGETKATCFWTRGGLPKLVPTSIVAGREQRLANISPGPNRQKIRSETFPGIAAAIAEQWGDFVARAVGE